MANQHVTPNYHVGVSKPITTNQTGVHDKLQDVVEKHARTHFAKPIQAHTLAAFETVQHWLAQQPNAPIILDSCCGVGESTYHHAMANPESRVIGIDKSAQRIGKHLHYQSTPIDNYLVIQADVRDFWRLVVQHDWPISHHYLLYPNPYPKSSQLTKRWYAHPAFTDLTNIRAKLTVRSNWALYIEEFAQALKYRGFESRWANYQSASPQTPFERKYWASGHQSWQLEADLNSEPFEG